ncbi:MAG: pncA [Chlamydiia bacterium]|nr:pncA [Chlamydiia bacterium]
MTKKALIIVDVQNDFLRGGALAVPKGDKVIDPINRLLKLPFDQIIASQDFHPKKHVSFAGTWGKNVGDRLIVDGIEQILWPDHCVEGTKGVEFSPLLDTSHFDKVIHKGIDSAIDSYSTFFDNEELKSTGLEDYLHSNGIKEIYFAGLATDYCVLYSVLDATRLGFQSYVILDACRGINLHSDDVECAVEEMKRIGAIVTTSDAVEKEFSKRSTHFMTCMFESCLAKQRALIELFQECTTAEEKYQKIIELGKTQSRLDPLDKTEKNLVSGCQSRMYLKSWMDQGCVFFESESDALISAGLGMLLLRVYSGEIPEVILKCPPDHIEVLAIRQTLTPGRANGLAAVYVRLKQDALRLYMEAERNFKT